MHASTSSSPIPFWWSSSTSLVLQASLLKVGTIKQQTNSGMVTNPS